MPERKAEKEKTIYYALCSDRDYSMLSGFEEMSVKDFERITYILESMDLWEFCAEITQKFEFQFHRCCAAIENGTMSKKQFQNEVNQYSQWLADFSNQLPTSWLRLHYLKKFKI